ncbi:MAG TPA: MFS transporter [Pyrinomonadaceae bacterium]|nr:MFS transporter [Pyrinomonadaceae bacterium]
MTNSTTESLTTDDISKAKIWKVIGASSAGTVIEWYDFYIFGSLAATISPLFYPKGNDTLAMIAYLSTFAVGFIVRPFGALFFGRIGDRVGRKYAFLMTLLLMGGATAAIGFLPTYETIGIFAPIGLILIRVLQGLALGGEYGGAAVYVAEHVPDNRRGFYTSFIQITASLGLLLSLAVILIIQSRMSAEEFSSWGWRVPFLLSILLVGLSLYIRLQMKESPIFQHIKSSGMASAKPIVEAFTNPENRRRVLISLFGATAGQGVVWYTGQFYALFYMQTVLKIERQTASYIIAIAIVLAIPLFIFFGALSDKIGRKKIMMAGCLLAVLAYYPIYKGMVHYAGNNVVAIQSTPDPVTKEPKLSPVSYATNEMTATPVTSAPNVNVPMMVLLIFIQLVFVTMVYAPIAAYLVEAFPAKIRYTSLSLPYHIGNGVFGGLLPTIGLLACAWTGNIYAGLWYPMIIASITFIVGMKYLPETHNHKIWEEMDAPK